MNKIVICIFTIVLQLSCTNKLPFRIIGDNQHRVVYVVPVVLKGNIKSSSLTVDFTAVQGKEQKSDSVQVGISINSSVNVGEVNNVTFVLASGETVELEQQLLVLYSEPKTIKDWEKRILTLLPIQLFKKIIVEDRLNVIVESGSEKYIFVSKKKLKLKEYQNIF